MSALPSLLTGDALPDIIGYDDHVRVTRTVRDGSATVTDPDTGLAVDGSVAAETVLYDDEADVQDGERVLERLAEIGEQERAQALCFLPVPVSRFQTGDRAETPLGAAEVVRVLHDDQSLALNLLGDAPRPTI